MTDKPISAEAKMRACELANEKGNIGYTPSHVESGSYSALAALARFIDSVDEMAREQVEQRKKFLPDAVVDEFLALSTPFILTRHDPLEEAIGAMIDGESEAELSSKEVAARLRAELAKRGGRIVFDREEKQ